MRCAALTHSATARAYVHAQVAKAMYGDMFDNTAPRKTKEAHCSWCYEFTTHFFIKDKDHWLCDACKGKTTESQRCSDAMARLEGSNKRSAVCAKSLPTWEEALERKKKAFSKQWNATKIRYELTRESPTRHQVAPQPDPGVASLSDAHARSRVLTHALCYVPRLIPRTPPPPTPSHRGAGDEGRASAAVLAAGHHVGAASRAPGYPGVPRVKRHLFI